MAIVHDLAEAVVVSLNRNYLLQYQVYKGHALST